MNNMLNYWFKSYLEENEDNVLKNLRDENKKLKRQVEELKIKSYSITNNLIEATEKEKRNKREYDVNLERYKRNFDSEMQTKDIYIKKINLQNDKFIENNYKIYQTLKDYVDNTAKRDIVKEFLLKKENFAELITYFEPTSKTLSRIRTLRRKYIYNHNKKYNSLTTYNYKDEKINALIDKLFYNELTYTTHEEEVMRLLICFCEDYYVNISMSEDGYMTIDNYFDSLYFNHYQRLSYTEIKQLKLFYVKYIEFMKNQ